jgi:L-ascorbate metabolism protein UlaG (beta-lactamase superfamily)
VRIARALALAALALALAVAWLLERRPRLDAYADLVLPAAPPGAGGLRATFLGVSTLLVSDGETQLMTDGFFSRPGLLRTALGRVAPDLPRIEEALARAGVERLAAVIPVHSHYDHAMDSPEVARLTGALLLGSESTANIGRGAGLPEASIAVAQPGVARRFGAFRVTLVPSRHVNFGINQRSLGGEIREPLVPPARVSAYAEGVTWSVHIGHPRGNLLVQGSAGFVEGALRDTRADVVFLGVGGLDRLDAAYRERYLAEVVEATGARLVIPVHYDDFTRPLREPLALMPSALGDFPGLMRDLREWCARRPGVRLGLMRVFEPVDLALDGA